MPGVLHHDRYTWATFVLVAAACVWSAFAMPLNMDVAWYLHLADRVVGGTSYAEFIEVNPPLILWLTLPVAYAAKFLGVANTVLFPFVVLATSAGSLWLVAAVLRRAIPDDRFARRMLLLAAAIGVGFLCGYNFGQREHFVAILVLPYVLMLCGRVCGRQFSVPMAILVGACAGIGVSIKPYYFLLPVVLEGYAAARSGWRAAVRRPELVAGTTFVVIYLAALPVLAPQYFGLIPLIRATYSAWDAPWGIFLSKSVIILIPLVSACVGMRVLPARDGSLRSVQVVLFLTTLVFLAIAAMQRKAWPNHLYPPLVTAVIFASITLVAVSVGRQKGGRWGIAVQSVVAAGIVVPLMVFVPAAVAISRMDGYSTELAELVRKRAERKRIAVLSTHLGHAFPLVNVTSTEWGLRYPSLWMLPGLYASAADTGDLPAYHRPAEQSHYERAVVRAVINDLRDHPPQLILVDRSWRTGGPDSKPFDFVEYFSQEPAFRTFFRGYTLVAQRGGMAIYERTGGYVN